MFYYFLIIINLILGFLSGILLAKMLVKSVIYRGPASNYIRKLIYKNNDNICHKLYPKVYICPISLSMSLNS